MHKNEQRVWDIISKARWNIDAMVKLATTQCKLISAVEKARGRANVAEFIFGPTHPLTLVFREKQKELEN